eukprot:Gb_25521 [translate_table: standard]
MDQIQWSTFHCLTLRLTATLDDLCTSRSLRPSVGRALQPPRGVSLVALSRLSGPPNKRKVDPARWRPHCNLSGPPVTFFLVPAASKAVHPPVGYSCNSYSLAVASHRTSDVSSL